MLTNDTINQLLGIDEAFHAPYRLMELIKDKEAFERLMESLLEQESDLTFDWFTDYFQMEHSDRKNKKQDFTPDGVVTLVDQLLGPSDSNADICAGTGGLTIKRWVTNPGASFYCEEFSDRALPFLLLNLAIRNIDATVFHGNSLTRECKGAYRIVRGPRFGSIEGVSSVEDNKVNAVVMNPPYSQAWEPEKDWIHRPRFAGYGALAPKSKADYAFLLQGLDTLADDGTMAIILPHGVLFRGSAEGTIRKALIEKNYLDTVIGLPEKLFLNTDIPTVVLVLKKNRKTKDILIVDASKGCTKVKANNILETEHIDKIVAVVKNRLEVNKYSRVVTLEEIQENEYNLNIPRYVDTFEEEPKVDLRQLAEDMANLDQEIERSELAFWEDFKELIGTNPKADAELKVFQNYFEKRVSRYGQLS